MSGTAVDQECARCGLLCGSVTYFLCTLPGHATSGPLCVNCYNATFNKPTVFATTVTTTIVYLYETKDEQTKEPLESLGQIATWDDLKAYLAKETK